MPRICWHTILTCGKTTVVRQAIETAWIYWNRMGQAGKGLSLGLMAAGTALVFRGLYAG